VISNGAVLYSAMTLHVQGTTKHAADSAPEISWRYTIGVPDLYKQKNVDKFALALVGEHNSGRYNLRSLSGLPVTPQSIKHLLPLYAATELRGGVLPEPARPHFSTGFAMRERLRTPGAHVAIGVTGCEMGIGDELLVTGPLLRALLNHSAELKLTLFTRRDFLYNHPRISIENSNLSEKIRVSPASAIIGVHRLIAGFLSFYEQCRCRSADGHPVFSAEMITGDNQTSTRILKLGRQNLVQAERSYGPMYQNSYEMLAYLGLKDPFLLPETRDWQSPFRPPVAKSEGRNSYMSQIVRAAARGKVVLLNLWGGESPSKGFDRDYLFDTTEKLTEEGFFVVVAPNGTRWGSNKITSDSLSYFGKNILILPDPSEAPGLLERAVHAVDLVVTCEGGMMHYAAQSGISTLLLLNSYSEICGYRYVPPYLRNFRILETGGDVTQASREIFTRARIS
jgi:hypothetical protein